MNSTKNAKKKLGPKKSKEDKIQKRNLHLENVQVQLEDHLRKYLMVWTG